MCLPPSIPIIEYNIAMTLIIWILFVLAISIMLHEFGHAWAARICGFDVDAIRFGLGDPIWRRRWNYIDITIGMPLTLFIGFVEYSDRGRGTILQHLFVACSGLAANALIVFLASLGNEYLRPLDSYWSFLGVSNMLIILTNLIPMPLARRGSYVQLWTDGGRILGLIQEKFTGRNFTERR